ncbi:DNA repair helicase XPB1, partial [Tanacetum coccineum]
MPEDIASATAFLASDEASYITVAMIVACDLKVDLKMFDEMSKRKVMAILLQVDDYGCVNLGSLLRVTACCGSNVSVTLGFNYFVMLSSVVFHVLLQVLVENIAVFRSLDYNAGLYCLRQYKAPVKIDLRLFDARHLFQGGKEPLKIDRDVMHTHPDMHFISGDSASAKSRQLNDSITASPGFSSAFTKKAQKDKPPGGKKGVNLRVKDILIEESNVQPVNSPITICGDIYGHVHDPIKLFQTGGDFADRGYNSLEVLLGRVQLFSMYYVKDVLLRECYLQLIAQVFKTSNIGTTAPLSCKTCAPLRELCIERTPIRAAALVFADTEPFFRKSTRSDYDSRSDHVDDSKRQDLPPNPDQCVSNPRLAPKPK